MAVEIVETHIEQLREITKAARMPDFVQEKIVGRWVELCEEEDTYCDIITRIGDAFGHAAIVVGNESIAASVVLFIEMFLRFHTFVHDPESKELSHLIEQINTTFDAIQSEGL